MSTTSLLIALSYGIPVDNVPPGRKVIWTAVLVLEVVGMLPDIVAHDRVVSIHERAVLIGAGDNLEFATLIKDEPRPTRAKTLCASIVECCLESVEGAKGGVDRACQIASG